MLVRKGKKIVEKKNDRQRTSRNKERNANEKKKEITVKENFQSLSFPL